MFQDKSFFMSSVMNFAPFVESTLFSNSFIDIMSVTSVYRLSSNVRRLPPIAVLVLFGSDFVGL